MVQLDPAEKDVAIEEVRRFVAEVFSGHRQLNVPFEAKSRRLKSLRKEPDKAKITLLSFFHPARDRFSWARQEMSECFGSGSVAFAGLQNTGWFGARAAFPIRSEVIQCRTQRGRTQVVSKRPSTRISPLLSRAEVAQW